MINEAEPKTKEVYPENQIYYQKTTAATTMTTKTKNFVCGLELLPGPLS